MENRKISLKDGLFKQNIVFMSGLLIAPVIACATTLMKSFAICMVFSVVSFFTILICRAVPRKIAYTIRVIIYSLAASAIYIPAVMLASAMLGEDVIKSAGVYLPILVTNSLILSKTESRFYNEPFLTMTADSAVFILGFDIACIFVGSFREIFASSSIGGVYLEMPFTIPALETTFGGFLLVGVFAGLFRGIYNHRKEKLLNPEPDEEDELAEYAEDMGEFLTGKKHTETEKPEKIKIYKTPKKRRKKTEPDDILEVSFSDNRSIVDEFAAIVAESAEMEGGEEDSTASQTITEEQPKAAEQKEEGEE